MNKINILGVNINNITCSEAITEVEKWLAEKKEKKYIVTPNPEIVIKAKNNEHFKKILNDASMVIPDGIGLIWAGKILGTPFKERVTGIDLMQRLCQMAENNNYSVGLLGGKNGVVQKTADFLIEKFPRLQISFAQEEWDNPSSASLLFVAMGAPKQEEWITNHLENIPVQVAMSVGGSFDYLSSSIPRAPKTMQNLGLEWLWRLIKEPWRFKRQIAIWHFALLILLKKLGI